VKNGRRSLRLTDMGVLGCGQWLERLKWPRVAIALERLLLVLGCAIVAGVALFGKGESTLAKIRSWVDIGSRQ
ncbi:hypothetical protein PanWU01x14_186100, partial [Parasponia andersonii]